MIGSTADVRGRLTLAARAIIADHWPSPDRCPICRVPQCEARTTAAAYLAIVGETAYIPARRAEDRRDARAA